MDTRRIAQIPKVVAQKVTRPRERRIVGHRESGNTDRSTLPLPTLAR